VISWDVWAAVAIAVAAIVSAVLFDQSPLLVFILVGSALCAYIAIRNRFDDDR
jgi:multidrug transporter EmrE-like cation transporter